jgi:6,7-dimethyl-8-ribityllumazine synthase
MAMRELRGRPNGHGRRFAIVAARFNHLITKSLVEGAIDALVMHGVSEDDIEVAWVPGSVEIPLIAKQLAESGRFAGVVCLGAVIRGETDHYDHVTSAATSGITRVGIDTGVPTTFGVLTCDTVEQALNRAGIKAGNNGAHAAIAALEMADLLSQL